MKNKEIEKYRTNTRFLCGLANFSYIQASKLTGLEDFTKQASKASITLTIDFQGVNKPLKQNIIPNLLT